MGERWLGGGEGSGREERVSGVGTGVHHVLGEGGGGVARVEGREGERGPTGHGVLGAG